MRSYPRVFYEGFVSIEDRQGSSVALFRVLESAYNSKLELSLPCSPAANDYLAVVVVGAGAAGLGAAMRLAAAKVSFTVLEARGRVGGRAHTVPAWGVQSFGFGLSAADGEAFA
ncbi:MAG: NAD(P)-binding protein, partial [Methylocapsa sp.]|nr:NAD(P)-binding protein [Methylocapsa sp.]